MATTKSRSVIWLTRNDHASSPFQRSEHHSPPFHPIPTSHSRGRCSYSESPAGRSQTRTPNRYFSQSMRTRFVPAGTTSFWLLPLSWLAHRTAPHKAASAFKAVHVTRVIGKIRYDAGPTTRSHGKTGESIVDRFPDHRDHGETTRLIFHAVHPRSKYERFVFFPRPAA